MKQQAENQRAKILLLKQQEAEKIEEADDAMEFEEFVPEPAPKQAAPSESKPLKLTEDNLSKMGSSNKGSVGPKS